jgi:hypothetical protein
MPSPDVKITRAAWNVKPNRNLNGLEMLLESSQSRISNRIQAITQNEYKATPYERFIEGIYK